MRFEGFHYEHTLPIKAKTRVVIPKGVRVHTMHPGRDDYATNRRQEVTVHHILPGQTISGRLALLDKDYRRPLEEKGFNFTELEAAYADKSIEGYRRFEAMTVATSNPKIVWAGTGQYWCEVDINDILIANGYGEVEHAQAA